MVKLAGFLVLLGLVAWLFHNIVANMSARGMNFSLSFLADPFGVDLSFHILPWQPGYSHAYALLVAITNTIFTSILAIALATLLGFVIGIVRLSSNPLAAGAAYALIEAVRNVPLLTQIIFLYVGVLQFLPQARNSIILLPDVFLNVRGLFVPLPQSNLVIVAAAIALLAIIVLLNSTYGKRLKASGATAVAAILLLAGSAWDLPVQKGFGFSGGWLMTPELLAVWWGVSLYVSAFIAEIVRSTLGGVAKGQREAAAALGLRWHQELFLVVLPQAYRAMIPPLTSQYLNIVKATTLGAAVAFPEVVQVMARSIMNQTGRSVEIMLIILTVYVVLNVSLALLMNMWNRSLEIPRR